MAAVLCEVSRGLRDSEATVGVPDVQGHRQFLRVEKRFLLYLGERAYLPIGIVYRDETHNRVLIELPHEADSGASRLWVPAANVSQLKRDEA
jgi:hypothetical protein